MSKTLDGTDGLSQLGDIISNGIITAASFSTGGPSFQYNQGPITLTATSSGVSDVAFINQNCYYTTIGNNIIVNIAGEISITANPTPAPLTLTGFPTGPDLSFGSCNLLQIIPTINPQANWPTQAILINGNMTFFPTQSSTPIDTDLSHNGLPIVCSITYQLNQLPL